MKKSRSQSSSVELIDLKEMDFRVCLMGICQTFDEDTNSVTVSPAYSERVMKDGREVEFEPLQTMESVPVGSVCGVRRVPEPGMHGMILFSDLDLDNYVLTRSSQPVNSSRFHDYADAVFIPMEIANTIPLQPIVIEGGKITITAPEGLVINASDVVTTAPEGYSVTAAAGICLNNLGWDQHNHIVLNVTSSGPLGTPCT